MKEFSSKWTSSRSRNKQRKYAAKAPLHIKRKLAGCHLSKELRAKHKTRTVILRKDDTVKVLRGNHRKKTGKIEKINLKKNIAFISGIDVTKKDGTKLPVAFRPSNLMITELNLDDKRRVEILERKKK